ncbi:LEAF RUST 10 DISEASE-RESISTANCE LOCUS RECEPTOR-LIKE PROTEIN KINASE-like 1.2 isoform X2 [Hevea brasiliensis]|uniref:LEAF RUST 10 DISEASE-RESISTANCE LOCUS RECEPTOR-LIKE PROTEIN KINASE-like 1.2 isoform X2 n=1 Tax=Hevea brasiliensis TaxID=3981 RepID=UPI0025EDBA16|nr:LEAF RUST 10 DISEASE-RESISTANCE LOCUS RECEPTOR-LIKE PROTEIN KINASE-like 1.2 isoform X2 [Hevea brasiliensis]
MSKPQYRCFFLVLFIFFFFFFMNSYCDDSALIPSKCSTHDCGNGVAIEYPFWYMDVNSSDEVCGYPEFGLSCSGDEPILKLPKDTYYVKNINYTNSTIALVDIDVTGQTCPRARHNLTLENLPLGYTNLDLNLSFYFNCTSSPFSYSVSAIGCLEFSTKQSYVSMTENQINDVDWIGKCEEKVVATVMRTEITTNGLISEFGGAMNNGFMLDWRTVKGCGSCEDSGGFCGYNKTAAEFKCFCRDGTVHSNRCKDNNPNVPAKVGIGVGAFLGGVIACVIVFIYLRRRRKPYAPSSFVSKSTTSDFSKSDIEKGEHYFAVHLFSYSELEEATNNFDSAKELGDGGFGTVYYGKLRDGRAVAVKRLYENNYKRVEQFMNEVDILTRLHHQHLVSLYGCTSRHCRELLLVYEYIPNGTVADHLHGERAKPGALPWCTRIKIAVETASALAYLHASDIIHRDVKTNNILLDNNFCVKVADFGLSRFFPMDVTHVSTAPQGTPGYVDPEYHECYQLTDKSDVYSFGVVLVELISSMPAVDITRHRHEINLSNMAINKIQSDALDELVDHNLGFESDNTARGMITAVAELAFQCLQSAKELRPSMEQVLETLKEIQNKDYDIEKKTQETDIPSDDVGLLKSGQLPRSPDTVMMKWLSNSTTPNISG